MGLLQPIKISTAVWEHILMDSSPIYLQRPLSYYGCTRLISKAALWYVTCEIFKIQAVEVFAKAIYKLHG